MVFYSKCENSIKGVLLLIPFMLALVNIIWFKRDVGETVIIFVMSISISLFILLFILSTKYVVEAEYLLIVRIFGRKKILYQNIDGILKKDGKISLEAPSVQQLWLMKGDKVLVQLSPAKMEKCEKRLNQQLMTWRLKNHYI
ncbi:MAG: PH domain-containing protein [Lachnospira sp.]